jgi:hypothetical protein
MFHSGLEKRQAETLIFLYTFLLPTYNLLRRNVGQEAVISGNMTDILRAPLAQLVSC